ncbi:MAG: GNAT family N-acetyltransferase [Clostridia bacterium]|nr:GNAT family N-acetyltransferase [Clostridia bacterium]
MEYNVREMQPNEYFLLNDILYNAIFIPQGVAPPPKNIIEQEELQVYVKDFGKQKDDVALVAEIDGKIIGAVWARIMNDYGHIDNDTPSLAISIYKNYRGYGIGTSLMQNMISLLKYRGYKRVSLAVQKENYAVRMYKRVGFIIVDENSEEYIMARELK